MSATALSSAAQKVLEERYLQPGEDWDALCWRVAHTVASGEVGWNPVSEDPEHFALWAKRFHDVLFERRFVPGSPILSNAGKAGMGYSSCFVLPIDDDMHSIMESLKHTAIIHKSGGGTGFSFSRLRPKGSNVSTTNSGAASGPVGFLRMYDAVTEEIKQGGVRRGANMGILRCLAGGTKVHTVNGKVAIKDLVGQRPYVYACDSATRKVHVVQADKVFVSDRNRELVRVWFDNDDYLDCTPDHRFMLKDGAYALAGGLQPGQSLMALEKRIIGAPDGRLVRTLACTGGRAEYEHRVVARDVYGMPVSYNWNAHHVDHDTLNNDPLNIQTLSRSDHATAHVSNLLDSQQRIAAQRKGRTLEEVYGPEKAAEWKGRMRDAKRKAANHRVARVEPIGYVPEVYDISLPAWHNFAAEEVFVHNCDHPDILEFIDCKRAGGITNFNISVAVTNEFMDKLTETPDALWRVTDPHTDETALLTESDHETHVSVSTLWQRIIDAAWTTGDPGLVFIDRINDGTANPIPCLGPIEATNPCGEQPLYGYDVCNLGSLNLGRYVQDGKVDWKNLAVDTTTAVRFLDNVIDVNNYPMPEIERMAKEARRIGLGVMGFHDMLIQLGIPYASEEALDMADKVSNYIRDMAHAASILLAEERSPFPLWEKSIFYPNKKMRNSTCITIAPTGTISIIADASSGIEPLFALRMVHDNSQGRVMEICNPVVQEYLDRAGAQAPEWRDEIRNYITEYGSLEDISESVVGSDTRALLATAQEIGSAWHVRMQAAWQAHTDNAVSKTINLPNSASTDDVDMAYRMAWETGCMGITVYRDGCKGAQVLNKPQSDKQQAPAEVVLTVAEKIDLEEHYCQYRQLCTVANIKSVPTDIPGTTYKVRSPDGTVNVTINRDTDGPIEVFINVGRAGTDIAALAEGLGRLCSLVLRTPSGISQTERLRLLSDQLRNLGGSRSVGFGDQRVSSVPDAVAQALDRHFSQFGGGMEVASVESVANTSAVRIGAGPIGAKLNPMAGASHDLCPGCGNMTLIHQEGCAKCVRCNYSGC